MIQSFGPHLHPHSRKNTTDVDKTMLLQSLERKTTTLKTDVKVEVFFFFSNQHIYCFNGKSRIASQKKETTSVEFGHA